MTRFAGDGNTLRLKLRGQKSGRVVSMEAHRVRSHRPKRQSRRGVRTRWRRGSVSRPPRRSTKSDYVQLHGYVPHLTRGEVADFAVEAAGHLLLAHRCPDGDPAQARNLELFHQRITDALLADAEAAGR